MDSGGVRKFVSSFATRRLLPTKTSLVVKFYQNPRRDLGVGVVQGYMKILEGEIYNSFWRRYKKILGGGLVVVSGGLGCWIVGHKNCATFLTYV